MIKTLILFVVAAGLIPAANLHKWYAVASCVASGFDAGATLYQAAHVPGIYEVNPVFRGPGGKPSAVRITVFKAAACGAGLYLASKRPSRALDAITIGQTGVYTWAATHNLRLTAPRQGP